MNIEVLQAGQEERARELREALEKRVAAHTGGSESVTFSATSEPDLLIYLGNVAAISDAAILARIDTALKSNWRVLPLVDVLTEYFNVTPEALHPINGDVWTSADEIAEMALRQIGLTERERRVFLSYRRKESTPLALQLYEKLTQAGYLVFLDYFSVDRGSVIQDRITQALHEMSFVLLLETQSAAESKWVAEEEIGYALNNRLGLLSIGYPEVKGAPAFPMIPPDRREQLEPGDLNADGRLTSQAETRVQLRIEQEHADQLRARRERLLRDVSEMMSDAGQTTVRSGPFSLVRTSDDLPALVIRICPRPASHHDMFELGKECARRKPENKPGPLAWVVSLPGGYPENLAVTQWIGMIQSPEVTFLSPLDIPGVTAEPEADQS